MGTYRFIVIITFLNTLTLSFSDDVIIYESRLSGSVFKEYKPFGLISCGRICKHTPICKSLNFVKAEVKCELNWGTKSTHNLSVAAGSTYVEIKNDTQVIPSACDQLQCSSKESCHELTSGRPICQVERCTEPLTISGVEYSEPHRPIITVVDVTCSVSSVCAELIDTSSINATYTPTYVCDPSGNWRLLRVSRFTIHTNVTDFDTARSRCIVDGGDLAILDSEQKNKAVQYAISRTVDGKRYYFFGLDDREKEGTFQWIDGKSVDYHDWDAHYRQPDNWRGRDDCASIWRLTLKWHDTACGLNNNYICENVISP